MDRKIKTIMIILIVLMVVVAIGGGVLYFATDLLKSDEALFKKYLAQDLKNIAEISDISDEEEQLDYIMQNNHTEKTDIKISYIESENDQEEFYNINIDGISNSSEKEYYKNIKTTYGSEVLSDIELLRQNETYGIRFADLVQQFVSIENATMPYVMSNIGLEGNKYFQEKMNLDSLKLRGLMDFSDEEKEKLKETYFNVIFSDIDKKSYSSKSGVMITLTNGEGPTTKQYILTLSKNDLDKIYKKILYQAMNDKIILSKLEKIDNQITEMGFVEPDGESLKDRYISAIQAKHDSIEYSGQNNEKIIFSVYQSKGITYRVSMKTDTNEYCIDFSNKTGKELSYRTTALTEQGEDVSIYSLKKNEDKSRHFSYKDKQHGNEVESLEINLEENKSENSIKFTGDILYKNQDINKLKFDINTEFDFSNKKQIEVKFEDKNNILLNNYENDKIQTVFTTLRERIIGKLEEKKSIINTKMLNNICLWIDKKENERINNEKNNEELKKQKFNNQFILYEGKNVEIDSIKKLIDFAGQNMKDYKIISEKKEIKLFIEPGTKNEAKAKELSTAIEKSEYQFDVKLEYDENGYINTIDIIVADEN